MAVLDRDGIPSLDAHPIPGLAPHVTVFENDDPGRRPSPMQALAAAFWTEVVEPLLRAHGFTDCGAALLGPGSEVLGFDDDRSTDHDVGPRVDVILALGHGDPVALDRLLTDQLPEAYGGLPCRYPTTADPMIRHRCTLGTATDRIATISGLDLRRPLRDEAWLTTPTQVLRSITDGPVFADPSGDLTAARSLLAWYPDPVFRYVLACQWHRLAQVEHLAPRAGDVGDELGSRLLSGCLAGDLIKLAFLLERRWAPYPKWLGTALTLLPLAAELTPHVTDLVTGTHWRQRQDAYVAGAAVLADRCNALGLLDPIDPSPRPFHTRPFPVLDADRFAVPLLASSGLADRGWRGAVDQWTDNTDLLTALPAR